MKNKKVHQISIKYTDINCINTQITCTSTTMKLTNITLKEKYICQQKRTPFQTYIENKIYCGCCFYLLVCLFICVIVSCRSWHMASMIKIKFLFQYFFFFFSFLTFLIICFFVFVKSELKMFSVFFLI